MERVESELTNSNQFKLEINETEIDEFSAAVVSNVDRRIRGAINNILHGVRKIM